MDLELEEPVEAEAEEAGERQNRTFIILVAIMGGLLLIGILAFCVWMFTVGRGVLTGGRVAIPPTAPPEATVIPAKTVAAAETATAEAALAPAQVSPEPTATPTPSPTPVPPSPTPTITAPQATPTPRATLPPRATPTPSGTGPTPVPTPTGTPNPPAQTGIGTYTALILAAGLVILLVISRRLRTATGGR
jgi:nitrate reductase NapE component